MKKTPTEIDRLRQAVSKLSKRVTTSNKRIDELLLSQKKLKDKIEAFEDAMFEDTVNKTSNKAVRKEYAKVTSYARYKGDTCINCIYRKHKYDTHGYRSYLLCDDVKSEYYGKEVEHNFWCKNHIWGSRAIQSLGGNDYSWNQDAKRESVTPQKADKKLFAKDFTASEEVEESIGD